jgi:transposase
VPDWYGTCGSAHHWARELASLGHTVKLMAPQFVKAREDQQERCRRCEGDLRSGRPAEHALCTGKEHLAAVIAQPAPGRQKFVAERTAQSDQIRGLMAEFVLVINKRMARESRAFAVRKLDRQSS